MGIFEKFKIGFKKSASTFTSGLREIIIKKEIDDKTLNEIEDFLIQSDVGVEASEQIKNIIHILELSSFQLERLLTFKPKDACILNLSEDHLDRYLSEKEYYNAKINITHAPINIP